METLKPRSTVFERSNSGNEWFHFDGTGGEQFDGAGIFAGRSAGTLQTDLAGDYLLQRKIYAGRDVTDQDDRAAFASGVDAGGDGFIAAYAFQGDIDSLIAGQLENL